MSGNPSPPNWSSVIAPWSSWVAAHLSSIVVPGVVSASVTVLLYVWIQRARPHLKMVRIHRTKHVAEWLKAAEADTSPEAVTAATYWQPEYIVLLRNYGDGTAYNIKVSGNTSCRPRVPILTTGEQGVADSMVVAGMPMWSDRLAALEAGKQWSVVAMTSTDKSLPPPVLKVSWTGLPRRGLLRHRRCLKLAEANLIETGWPGKTDDPPS